MTSWSRLASRTKCAPSCRPPLGELGCVARPLPPDADRVELVVRVVGGEPADSLAEPAELGACDLAKRDLRRAGSRVDRRGLEPRQELGVAGGGHGLEHGLARFGVLLLEQREEARRRAALAGRAGHVVAQALEQDVEVADRPECAAEPGELGSEAVGPRRVEERRAARSSARRRRVATRDWCRSSASSPSRVPGSWEMGSPTWSAIIAPGGRAGAPRGAESPARGKNPSARKTFGRQSLRDARRREHPIRGKPSSSPSSGSTSSSTKRSRTRRPSRTVTVSRATSATAPVLTSPRPPLVRRRPSRGRGRAGRPGAADELAGGAPGPPGPRARADRRPAGSLSCQSPRDPRCAGAG